MLRQILPLCLVALAACAHFPRNEAMGKPGPNPGYRFEATASDPSNVVDRPGQRAGLFVVLTLSGGGTRAAAFSYAVMKALDTPMPGVLEGSLLDEVDVISSVSGGSFASAYYALHGKQMFQSGKWDFEKEFLRRDVQGDLFWRMASPLNWIRVASSAFDRVDMAAEYYDETIFDRASFADMVKSRASRPFVFVNATDMSRGSRFEFTQDQFDLMHSDLSNFPVARAVAASSAFPGLLSPVRLVNWPDEGQVSAPRWIENAIASDNDVRERRGLDAQSYLDMEAATKQKRRRYVHLLDGGLSDNIGLRGTLDGLVSTDPDYSLLKSINRKLVKRVVIIVVDAKTKAPTNWDERESAPGLKDVLMTTATMPMENYSAETTYLTSQRLEQRKQAWSDKEALRKRIVELHGELTSKDAALWRVESNFIHLSFEDVADEADRKALLELPTSFALDKQQVDLVLRTVPELLGRSKGYLQLQKDLAADKDAARADSSVEQ